MTSINIHNHIHQDGWVCNKIVDLHGHPLHGNNLYTRCDICGRRAIRYAHYIENKEINLTLTAGAVCAFRICNNQITLDINKKSRRKKPINKEKRAMSSAECYDQAFAWSQHDAMRPSP